MGTVEQKANHEAAMVRAFGRQGPALKALHRARKESGHWAPKYADWVVEFWADENEADDRPFPLRLPDPEIGPDGILWGASATMIPEERLDPECAWEARPTDPPDSPVAQDVSAWLESFYEPMTIADLAELTGYSYGRVRDALHDLRLAGFVARQETATSRNGRPPSVWLWRRLPQL
jgi:DprA/Smf-like nucleotide binding protein involved in DNA uptake